jgi:hypothetical protein
LVVLPSTRIGGGGGSVVKVHVLLAAIAFPATSLTPALPPLTVAV